MCACVSGVFVCTCVSGCAYVSGRLCVHVLVVHGLVDVCMYVL